jgi:hypothetical protein
LPFASVIVASPEADVYAAMMSVPVLPAGQLQVVPEPVQAASAGWGKHRRMKAMNAKSLDNLVI